jgi:hypothetical protein
MRALYKESFESPLRMLYDAHVLLHTQDIRTEKGEYALAMLSPTFDERAYLIGRYHHELTLLKRRYSVIIKDTLRPHQVISFWLRREIDGTGRLLWGGLVRLMTSFDRAHIKQ